MSRGFSANGGSSEKLEILILTDRNVNDLVSILESSDLQFDWHQANSLIQKKSVNPDLVLYDANLTEISLNATIAFFSVSSLQIPVLVINGNPEVPAAVAAIKAGAVDYLALESLAELPQAILKVRSQSASHLQFLCNTHSDRQLQRLIADNPDGIIVVDESGKVLFVNPAGLELLGKPSSELMGEALGFPVVNGDYLEVDLPINKNKNLVAQMRVSQIQWQGVKAYVVSLRDITQLKQAEEERAKLLEEAQAANRAKDEFLAILSHELRTPLNPIVGWSQLLARGGLSAAEVKQGGEIIQRNAMLQTKLISDILDISRIIQGKLKLQVTSVDLADTIDNALETVSLAAQAKSIKISTHVEDVGFVEGDSTRLQQVIWNLLANAVKFTPTGGTIEVRLSSVQHQLADSAQIQIIDSGKGIAPKFLPHVFDYFRQAESTKSRSEGGLGLGLAIVRRLTELHGGDVTVSSLGLGMGATFTVYLPLLDRHKEAASPASILQGKNLLGKKILVVDDDDDSRNLICFILQSKGAEIDSASSAVEALVKIEQFQPNILISDIGMPQMNGYELIQRIRQLQPNINGNVKAIAISGYVSEQDRQKSISAGFDFHLNKPLDISSLIDAVRN